LEVFESTPNNKNKVFVLVFAAEILNLQYYKLPGAIITSK